jgi:hypothetical protein
MQKSDENQDRTAELVTPGKLAEGVARAPAQSGLLWFSVRALVWSTELHEQVPTIRAKRRSVFPVEAPWPRPEGCWGRAGLARSANLLSQHLLFKKTLLQMGDHISERGGDRQPERMSCYEIGTEPDVGARSVLQ